MKYGTAIVLAALTITSVRVVASATVPKDVTLSMIPIAMLNGRVSAVGGWEEGLLAGVGNRLYALDRANAEYQAQLELDGQPVHSVIDFQGQTLVNAGHRLYKVDTSRPSDSLRLQLWDDDVYLSNGDDVMNYWLEPSGNLQIYEMSGRSGPRLVRTDPTIINPRVVEIDGTTAYISMKDGSLIALDVTDPLYPTALDEITTTMSSRSSTVRVHNDTAYLFSDTPCDQNKHGRLSIVDVSEPRNLRVLSRLNLEQAPDWRPCFNHVQDHYHLEWLKGYLYIFSPEDGLAIVDVRDPANALLIQLFDGTTVAGEVLRQGERLFVGRSDFDLDVLDTSNPEWPRLVERKVFPNRGESYRLWKEGDRIYVLGTTIRQYTWNIKDERNTGEGEYDLRILDVSKSSSPQVLGTISLYTGTLEPSYWWFKGDGLVVRSRDDRAIALVKNELVSIDVSDPTKPRIMSRTVFPGRPRNFEWVGRYGLIGDGETGRVDVLDLIDPDRPLVLKYPLPTSAETMGLLGDLIFTFTKPPAPRDGVGASSTTLRLMRLDATGKPMTIGSLAVSIQYIDYMPFTASGTNNWLFVGNNSLHKIDVSDPRAPRTVVSQAANFGTFGGGVLAAGDDRVILWLRHNGCAIQVYDQIDTATMRSLGIQSNNTSTCATDAVVSDGYVYVANRYDGLTVNYPLLPGAPAPTARLYPTNTATLTPVPVTSTFSPPTATKGSSAPTETAVATLVPRHNVLYFPALLLDKLGSGSVVQTCGILKTAILSGRLAD